MMEALRSLPTRFVMDLAFLTAPDVEDLVVLVGGRPNVEGLDVVGLGGIGGLLPEALQPDVYRQGRCGKCQQCVGECLLGFMRERRPTARNWGWSSCRGFLQLHQFRQETLQWTLSEIVGFFGRHVVTTATTTKLVRLTVSSTGGRVPCLGAGPV